MTAPDFVRGGIKKAAERRAHQMGVSTTTSETLTIFRAQAKRSAKPTLRRARPRVSGQLFHIYLDALVQ